MADSQVTDTYFEEMSEGAEAKSSLYTQKIHVNHLVSVLKGSTPLQQIGVTELQGYVAKRSRQKGHKGKTVQPDTIKKELVTFGLIFNFDRKYVLIREKKRVHAVRESFRQVQMSERLEKIMKEWFVSHPGGLMTICGQADGELIGVTPTAI